MSNNLVRLRHDSGIGSENVTQLTAGCHDLTVQINTKPLPHSLNCARKRHGDFMTDTSTPLSTPTPDFDFTCPLALAEEILPVIERLIRDDDDGDAYRSVASFWCLFERPILQTYAGGRYLLQTEGPQQRVDGFDFAMGSEIMGPLGWARLDPVETAALVAEIKRHIDRVIGDWCTRNPRTQGKRKPVDRECDDVAAVKRMTAWVAQVRRDGEASNVH
jgi:hypothetical protein